MATSPESKKSFDQICQIGLRRQRIIDSVGAHFGKTHVQSILSKKNLLNSLLIPGLKLEDFLTEISIQETLATLAHNQQLLEALTVETLLSETSVYQSHVEEQILFGARIAGQEASRLRFPEAVAAGGILTPQEAISAAVGLTYCGLPSEHGFFLILRPFGSSTIHLVNQVHMRSWKQTNVDISLMEKVKESWIKGILDILCSELSFSRSIDLSKADKSIYHFHKQNCDAHP